MNILEQIAAQTRERIEAEKRQTPTEELIRQIKATEQKKSKQSFYEALKKPGIIGDRDIHLRREGTGKLVIARIGNLWRSLYDRCLKIRRIFPFLGNPNALLHAHPDRFTLAVKHTHF